MLPQRTSASPSRRAALLVLVAVAGCVDAVAFSEFGGFFVAFMSGNSTRLGVAIGQHDWALAGFAFGIIAVFTGGVAAGRLIGDRFGPRRATVLLVLEALLLGIASWLYGDGGAGYAPPLMAAAMGIANSVLLADDATSITGVLVRIGDGLARASERLAFDLLLWVTFVAGVIGGALGDLASGGVVLRWPAAVLVLLALWRWFRD